MRLILVPTALAFCSLLVAAAALIVATRADSNETEGRRVTIGGVASMPFGEPVLYEDDDFYFVRLPDREPDLVSARAYYVYAPHGVFGIVKGCKIIWRPDETYEDKDGQMIRGLFQEPCGGSKYAVDGERIYGPGRDRLDGFFVDIRQNEKTAIVDTRVLFCAQRTGDQCRRSLSQD
jgi:hypothetical protein